MLITIVIKYANFHEKYNKNKTFTKKTNKYEANHAKRNVKKK